VTLAADLERAREGLRRAAVILRSHAGDDVPYELKGGWAPDTAYLRFTMKHGTPLMPSRRA